jgi:trehalose-6-phosphate synthase
MDPDERREKREACAAVVRENDIAKWFREQLRDVRRFSADASESGDARPGGSP